MDLDPRADAHAQMYGYRHLRGPMVTGPPPPVRRRKRWPWIVAAVLAGVGAVVLMIGLTTDLFVVATYLDREQVPRDVAAHLTKHYGYKDVRDVACDLVTREVEVGVRYPCMAQIDGRSMSLTLTIVDADKAVYEVSQPR